MAWWPRVFQRTTLPNGLEYRVTLQIYSQDGKRCSEVRMHRDGTAFFVDRECIDGTTFRDRGQGEEIGPFPSPKAAKAAAESRPWFYRCDD